MFRKLFFTLQYLFNNPPWDTGITPPELYAYLEENTPGCVLDLGCGTGTNALTMANYGWQVTGIDYVPRAIRTARRKVRRAVLEEQVNFVIGDVLNQRTVKGEYDLILDIGCFHSMSGSDIKRYAEYVSGHLVSGGRYLLYVHLNLEPGPGHGIHESDLAVLEEYLTLVKRQDGQETDRISAWLEFRK